MNHKPLQVTYVELPAPSFEATKKFYTETFGWQWTEYAPTYAAYELSAGAQIEVGLNGTATSAPPHEPGSENSIGPLVLCESADLEASLAEVTTAGGEIVSAIYPYPGGRRFHFADPSGNILGVYQPD